MCIRNLICLCITYYLLNTSQALASTLASSFAEEKNQSNSNQVINDNNTNEHASSSNAQLFTSNSSAISYADYGLLKVFAEANSGKSVMSSAGANASFTDSLLFNSESLDGTDGTAVIKIKTSYAGTATGGSLGSSSFQLTLQGAKSLNSAGKIFFQATGSRTSATPAQPSKVYDTATAIPLNGYYSIAVPIIFGRKFEYTLTAAASAGALSNSSGIMDSYHSTYWGGISQVLDGYGNPVSNFNVTSTSGTNYQQDFSVLAIPEPETYAMLAGGLGVMGFSIRRRQSA